ncbi:DUF1801 domain-containing protein [Spirosoma arcticum]
MTVDDYINQQMSDHQRILRWLRQLILTSDSDIRERISWKVPFYTCHATHLCYLNVVRSEPMEVDLAFVQGSGLPDEAGLLESRGRKKIKSLIIRNVGNPEEDVVRTYLQEALLLNDNRSI